MSNPSETPAGTLHPGGAELEVGADGELPPPWLRVALTLAISVGLLFGVMVMFFDLVRAHQLVLLVTEHPSAFIGIPWAGGASFSVVLVCRASFGNVKFGIGKWLTFDGASGPIVLWVLCFAAHVAGIHILWGCT